jgi:hypothetical protein
VAPPALQVGAGAVDLSEHRNVADGLEHVLAVAQELLSWP